MPEYTVNYNLTKPLESEFYDIGGFNRNNDKIDELIKALNDQKISADNSGKLPAGCLPSVIDCGYFTEETPVVKHNESSNAHTAMIIDGNVEAAAGTSTDEELHAHEIDPNAHPNLHIDGNII